MSLYHCQSVLDCYCQVSPKDLESRLLEEVSIHYLSQIQLPGSVISVNVINERMNHIQIIPTGLGGKKRKSYLLQMQRIAKLSCSVTNSNKREFYLFLLNKRHYQT